MFLKSALDKNGFWDTIGITPASIDWCEPNYVVSEHIAEFQNTISSLAIMVGGLIGAGWAIKYRHHTSLTVFSLLIAFVGFGSALFHGTLLFIPQLLDELPMMYAMCAFYYIFIQVARSMTTIKHKWYKNLLNQFEKQNGKRMTRSVSVGSKDSMTVDQIDIFKQYVKINLDDQYSYLKHFKATIPFYYIAHAIDGTILSKILGYNVGMTLTVIMLITSLLHSSFGFVFVFQFSFFIMSAAAFSSIVQLPTFFSEKNDNTEGGNDSGDDIYTKGTHERYRNWVKYYLVMVLAAFSFWLIDNNFCHVLLTKLPFYLSGHALWHWLNYFSTYGGIVIAGYAIQMGNMNAKVDMDDLQTRIELFLTTKNNKNGLNNGQNDEKNDQMWAILEENIKLIPGGVKETHLVSKSFINICSPQIGIDNLGPLYDLEQIA